jgi:hypothetical protein
MDVIGWPNRPRSFHVRRGLSDPDKYDLKARVPAPRSRIDRQSTRRRRPETKRSAAPEPIVEATALSTPPP